MKREFEVQTTTKITLDIPDRIVEGEDQVLDLVVNMWLDRKSFGFSLRLRDDLYSDDHMCVAHAVLELTRLYDAAILARAALRPL